MKDVIPQIYLSEKKEFREENPLENGFNRGFRGGLQSSDNLGCGLPAHSILAQRGKGAAGHIRGGGGATLGRHPSTPWPPYPPLPARPPSLSWSMAVPPPPSTSPLLLAKRITAAGQEKKKGSPLGWPAKKMKGKKGERKEGKGSWPRVGVHHVHQRFFKGKIRSPFD